MAWAMGDVIENRPAFHAGPGLQGCFALLRESSALHPGDRSSMSLTSRSQKPRPTRGFGERPADDRTPGRRNVCMRSRSSPLTYVCVLRCWGGSSHHHFALTAIRQRGDQKSAKAETLAGRARASRHEVQSAFRQLPIVSIGSTAIRRGGKILGSR